MKTGQWRITVSLTTLLIFLSLPMRAQDTLTASHKPLEYSTIGFQASQVSGIGISYGRNRENDFRFRITGGIITTGDKAYFSFGADYEFELTKNKPYRVFIGPAGGAWGVSDEPAHFNVALGVGIEKPTTGPTIFEDVTIGAEIYYPTFSFLTGTIGVAGGVFISYNF
ncbi:MAG: hypothetical protein KGJ59_13385 [Bacteroidota bacterium]|nr:hypothetical protein [Bacteroidota bacterium]